MYWADASSEIAFVVATNSQLYGDPPVSGSISEQSPGLGERSISDASPAAQQRAQQAKGRTLSLDSDKTTGISKLKILLYLFNKFYYTCI